MFYFFLVRTIVLDFPTLHNIFIPVVDVYKINIYICWCAEFFFFTSRDVQVIMLIGHRSRGCSSGPYVKMSYKGGATSHHYEEIY